MRARRGVVIRTPDEIAKSRRAGRLAADVLEMIAPYVKAGVSTDELDRICHDYIVNVQQAVAASLPKGVTVRLPIARTQLGSETLLTR